MSNKKRFFDFSGATSKSVAFLVVFNLIAGVGVVLGGMKLWDSHTRFVAAQQAEEEDARVGRFALIVMELVRAPLSEHQRQIMAQTIVRVTRSVFETTEERKAFAVVLAIESKFNRNAKSPAGAVGVSQVIGKFAKEFGAKCGIKGFHEGDLMETETNMLLGACQFKTLLKSMDGVVELALVAYNAGPSSKSIKELKSLGSITNSEAANYVPKFSYLHSIAKKQLEREETADK